MPPASHQKFYQFTPPLLRALRIQIQIHAVHKTVVCYTAVFSVVTQRSSPLTGRGGGEKRCVTILKTAV